MMGVGDVDDAVAREAARREVDGVVGGHIHQAALRLSGTVGEWGESGRALVEYLDGRLELVCPSPGPGGRGKDTRAPTEPSPS